MAVDRRTIEDQLIAIGEAERWWDQREVRELPHILNPDERIRAIVSGWLKRPLRPARRWLARSWLVAVTEHRVICIRKGEAFGRKELDIPLAPVTSIGQRTGLFMATISIVSGDTRHRIRVAKSDALKLIGALSALIRRIEPLPPVPSAPALPGHVSREAYDQVLRRIDLVEEEIERLRQQADFVEDLLKRRETSLFASAGILPEQR
jgi:hypothetical protein